MGTRPIIRQTHTYAALEISKAAWEEIARKLRAAGYDHAFDLQERAIDMSGIGVVEQADADPEVVRVPVVAKFGDRVPVGWIQVGKDALPATPNFCFALGFNALQGEFERGIVPQSRYIGTYDLVEVAIVDDESYAGYLTQVGVKAEDANKARELECWQMVLQLRDKEVTSVEILADNPDGPPYCAVDCHGEWTGWSTKRFEGKTLHEALTAAVAAKREAEVRT